MRQWLLALGLGVLSSIGWASDSDPKAAVAPLLVARDAFYRDVEQFSAGSLTEVELVDRIGEQFAPLLDGRKIALRVMGRFARDASAEERDAFSEKLQSSLVEAYARGLAGYGGEQLSLPEEAVVLKPGRALVDARLEAPGKEDLPIQFALGYDDQAGWRVENVSVAGINLGLSLRNQFADLVKVEGGVNGAIAAWSFDSAQASTN